MKSRQLIATFAAIAAFATAGSALADQTYPYVDFSGFKSTKTRAEVMAELRDSQAGGRQENRIAGGSEFTAPDANFNSAKTRAQVMAELRQAQEDGSYALAHQEFDGQVPGLQNGGAAGTRLASRRDANPVN